MKSLSSGRIVNPNGCTILTPSSPISNPSTSATPVHKQPFGLFGPCAHLKANPANRHPLTLATNTKSDTESAEENIWVFFLPFKYKQPLHSNQPQESQELTLSIGGVRGVGRTQGGDTGRTRGVHRPQDHFGKEKLQHKLIAREKEMFAGRKPCKLDWKCVAKWSPQKQHKIESGNFERNFTKLSEQYGFKKNWQSKNNFGDPIYKQPPQISNPWEKILRQRNSNGLNVVGGYLSL